MKKDSISIEKYIARNGSPCWDGQAALDDIRRKMKRRNPRFTDKTEMTPEDIMEIGKKGFNSCYSLGEVLELAFPDLLLELNGLRQTVYDKLLEFNIGDLPKLNQILALINAKNKTKKPTTKKTTNKKTTRKS